jgi:hypothetical protein
MNISDRCWTVFLTNGEVIIVRAENRTEAYKKAREEVGLAA